MGIFRQKNVLDIACKLMENAVAEEAYRTLGFLNLQLDLWERAREVLGDMIYIPLTRIIAFFKRFGLEDKNGKIKEVLQAARQFNDAAEALEVQSFQRRFYFPTLKAPEGYQAFLQICKQDAEISRFIIYYLDEAEKAYLNVLENIRFLREMFSKES